MEHTDLFLTMFHAQSDLLLKRIEPLEYKEVWNETKSVVLDIMMRYVSWGEFRAGLSEFRQRIDAQKQRFSWWSNPKPTKLECIDMTLDIIDSIQRRFVTGGESVRYVKRIDKLLR